jgi:hypothetical protein
VVIITGLDDVERRKVYPLPRLEFLPLGHPAGSQSMLVLFVHGDNVGSIEKTEVLLHTSNEVGLEVNAEKAKYNVAYLLHTRTVTSKHVPAMTQQ